MLLSAGSDAPLCLPLPPCCLTLTQGLVSGAGILSLLWKWELVQPSKLTECPKTHTASRADTPLTTCDDGDVLLSVILTRSRSLYLPAHPPGHLSSKIFCTRLAGILSLPCWGGWPGSLQGASRKEPLVSLAVLLGGGGRGRSLGEAQGHFLALAAPRPWVGISAEWQRQGSQICLVCGLKPQLLGFPRLLERQPFGEAPVFPGGTRRAVQDT